VPQYAYKDLKIELDGADALLKNISAYVTSINGWSKERILEEITAAGDVTDRHAPIGFLQKSDVVLTGPYDNAANSLTALANAWNDDTARTLQLTFDGAAATDVETVECYLAKFERNPSRGALHECVVTLKPTGAVA
jgi:hypothetical protein